MPLPLRAIAAAAVLVGAMVFPARADEPIGVAAAVNPQGVGTPPGSTPQSLEIGQAVVFDERIATAEKGQTQILFRDQSSLAVGPASDLVIDQFVYDPHAGIGKLAMSATKGVFRFVGGGVSKLDNPVTLTTPSGTLGIRGGIFLARVAPEGGLVAVFLYGTEMIVTGRSGATVRVRRPGFAVSIDRVGADPSAPFPAPRELIAALIGEFDGPVATRLVTELSDARVAADGLFARLAAQGDLTPQDRGLAAVLAAHPLLDALATHDFNLGDTAFQGDGRLLQLIEAFCQRHRC